MHEMAVEYKVKFQTISSFFGNDIEKEKDYLSKILAGDTDTPFQIYNFTNDGGIFEAHFHIYFPFDMYEGNTFLETLSTKTDLVDFDILEIREQHI